MNKKLNIGIVGNPNSLPQDFKIHLDSMEDIELIFGSPNGLGFSLKKNLEANNEVPHVMLVELEPLSNTQEVHHRIQELKSHYPTMKILIFSSDLNPHFISDSLQTGAHGYLVKDLDSSNDILTAIIDIHMGGSHMTHKIQRLLNGYKSGKLPRHKTEDPTNLTSIELEILKLICQQKTTSEISTILDISSKTVVLHRSNLLRKTGTKDLASIAMYAVKHQIIDFS